MRTSAATPSRVAKPKPKQSAAKTTPRRVPSPRCTDVSKDVPTYRQQGARRRHVTCMLQSHFSRSR